MSEKAILQDVFQHVFRGFPEMAAAYGHSTGWLRYRLNSGHFSFTNKLVMRKGGGFRPQCCRPVYYEGKLYPSRAEAARQNGKCHTWISYYVKRQRERAAQMI